MLDLTMLSPQIQKALAQPHLVDSEQLFLEILQSARNLHASDIHIEPKQSISHIRLRIDGLLYPLCKLHLDTYKRLINLIKVRTQLDNTKTITPQDGHLVFPHNTLHHFRARVSLCPTVHGEKCVIRFFTHDNQPLSLEHLGLELSQLKLLIDTIQQPQGLILFTGPTGSGKSATLYSILHYLKQQPINIMTAEDPVEMMLSGINQVAINPDVGMTYTTALRTFLRQDPDIIMLGEIRDPESLNIAIQSAHTGHLVLSTLHTNSSAKTLTRLLSMGVDRAACCDALQLIVSQRLIRLICTTCHGNSQANCSDCLSGYRGRTGIYELLHKKHGITHSITQQLSGIHIQTLAIQKGMLTLQQAAKRKLSAQLTTAQEIQRVLPK